jgi:hypothetical protein
MAGLLDLAGSAVQKVTFRSNLAPEIESTPFAPGQPAPPSQGGFSLMSLVQPEVIIQTPVGPIQAAPYGEPSKYGWVLAWAAAGLMMVGGVVTIGYIAQRMKK